MWGGEGGEGLKGGGPPSTGVEGGLLEDDEELEEEVREGQVVRAVVVVGSRHELLPTWLRAGEARA